MAVGSDWIARIETSPGLDGALLAELRCLGIDARESEDGIVFAASYEALARVHHGSRIAERVWVRIGRAPASSLDALAHGVRVLPWRSVVQPRQQVDVVVRGATGSIRRGSVATRKVEHAVADALRGPRLIATHRPPPPLLVRVDLRDKHGNVWVDASGDAIYRRGWRPETGPAPLRESVAAGILHVIGWEPGVPLVDPMCGAGTIAIEAARWAAGLPVHDRAVGSFMFWPMFASSKRQRFARAPAIVTHVYGYDRDPGAVAMAQRNAARGGVGAAVMFAQEHFSELRPPERGGWLVANPPWGRRLASEQALPKMLASWRTALAAWHGWNVAWLVPDARSAAQLGAGFTIEARLRHGGAPVLLAVRRSNAGL